MGAGPSTPTSQHVMTLPPSVRDAPPVMGPKMISVQAAPIIAAPVSQAAPMIQAPAVQAAPVAQAPQDANLKAKIDIFGKVATDCMDVINAEHANAVVQYKQTDFSDLKSLGTFTRFAGEHYPAGLLKKLREVDNKHIPALNALPKEGFSQPDLGTVAGWSVFWILLVLILCIVLAVYFKQPAQLFKPARVDAKV
jgi:hypothetical protein